MIDIMKWAGIAVCAVVLAGCICRIDALRPQTNKAGWSYLYILFAVFAGGVLIDLSLGHAVDWYVAAGVAGILAHMALTRRLWRGSPPLETLRD